MSESACRATDAPRAARAPRVGNSPALRRRARARRREPRRRGGKERRARWRERIGEDHAAALLQPPRRAERWRDLGWRAKRARDAERGVAPDDRLRAAGWWTDAALAHPSQRRARTHAARHSERERRRDGDAGPGWSFGGGVRRALSARALGRKARAELLRRKTNQRQRLRRDGARVRNAEQRGYERDVAKDAPVRHQSTILRHVADHPAQRHARHLAHASRANRDRATARLDEAVEAAQQRGLPRSALANERDAPSRRDVEAHAVEREHVAVALDYFPRAERERLAARLLLGTLIHSSKLPSRVSRGNANEALALSSANAAAAARHALDRRPLDAHDRRAPRDPRRAPNHANSGCAPLPGLARAPAVQSRLAARITRRAQHRVHPDAGARRPPHSAPRLPACGVDKRLLPRLRRLHGHARLRGRGGNARGARARGSRGGHVRGGRLVAMPPLDDRRLLQGERLEGAAHHGQRRGEGAPVYVGGQGDRRQARLLTPRARAAAAAVLPP